jgi:hypothetical protein
LPDAPCRTSTSGARSAVRSDDGAWRRYERSRPDDVKVATTVVPGGGPFEGMTRVLEVDAGEVVAGLELVGSPGLGVANVCTGE